ncbi:Protein-glutamate methylesterase/protein-glutamine glutaminase [Candidatus Lokiarchaeum ossiferum]|uniref:Protein-glutamate methylesterase/protein-glutamine glutaminase n=1 Tax=Candidatus Lokiarchaeum ossiferum TaxID=2951803 RepID=A0ABY6HMF3_9ARCH|nr:Protein-glutamate methylesterase/protein-glutamine glutaminase [Candidatus Lokiarchaeum sp. B-35]
MYNVLVVDDSVFMRKIISDLINSDPQFKVIATARNGNEALDKVRIYNPDVVTLDIEMPIMNGLEALYNIMNKYPRPVIMLSAYSQKEAQSTFKAIELGAIDFVPKPSGEISLDLNSIRVEILNKLRSAVQAKIRKIQAISRGPISFQPSSSNRSTNQFIEKILVIASSTGGPRALVEVIPNLPINIDCPILVVQHMQSGFTKSFADRLNSLSILPVSEARQDEIIQNGHVYVAPGDFHMTIVKDPKSKFPLFRIQLDEREKMLGVRPNADYLFESAAAIFPNNIVGVVLTGMGRDGSRGSNLIKNVGGYVITEDESTSVVFGMPKMAAPYADMVAPLYDIPQHIITFIRKLNKKEQRKKN